METTVTLAELSHNTRHIEACAVGVRGREGETLPVSAQPAAPLASSRRAAEPSEADIATLTAQYRKAVNGLYEAYVFGQMLLAVKRALEGFGEGAARPLDPAAGLSPARQVSGDTETLKNQGFTGDTTRGTAREMTQSGANGGTLAAGGWNAGTGLKAWLAEHCPEINYSTARRFLAVAEKTNAALALQAEDGATGMSLPHAGGLVMSAEGAPSSLSSFSPSEAQVRAFLEGKSQRQIIGGKRAGAGRPRKDWEAALGQSPEAAMKRLEEALAPLNELVVVKRTHRMLSEVDLETVRAAIDLLHERVHEDR